MIKESQLYFIFQRELGIKDLNRDTTLSSLGLDSMSIYRLINLLDEQGYEQIDNNLVLNATTLGDLLNILNNDAPQCLLDEVIMIICEEVNGVRPSGISLKIDKNFAQIQEITNQIFGTAISLADNSSIATIRNKITTKLTTSEIEEKAQNFVEAINGEQPLK